VNQRQRRLKRARDARYRASKRYQRLRRRWWRAWLAKPGNRQKHNDRRRDLRLKERGVDVSKPPGLESVWRGANGKCWLCGLHVKFPGYHDEVDEQASIDHVVPISKGGKHTWANTKLAHLGCNAKKKDGVVPEAGPHLAIARRA
jgi:5-methylcytosine-specific restriction endonuclease McrA